MIYNAPAFWREAEFRRSSFSGSSGGDCIELAWRKSSYSGGNGGDCVEVVCSSKMFGIRDSKNTDGPVFWYCRRSMAWRSWPPRSSGLNVMERCPGPILVGRGTFALALALIMP